MTALVYTGTKGEPVGSNEVAKKRMTMIGLPLRTAIAVVVVAVIGAFSVPATRADDAPPDTTETTVTAAAQAEESTTTTAAAETEESTTTTAPTSTTTTIDPGPTETTTTTVAETTTTIAETTTTTVAETTTTTGAPATTTTTTTMAATTTTVAPTTTTTVAPTTTTTLPAEPDAEDPDAHENVCNPDDDPSTVDTDGTDAESGDDAADTGDTRSDSTTTTAALTEDSAKSADSAETDGEAISDEDADSDPCNPPEDEDIGFTPVERIDVVRDIVFPIVGRAGYYDGFGACRDGCAREHHGIDIGTFGWKGLPVVASHAGTVVRTTYDQRLAGCAVILRGEDGWESRYVHLNTDSPGTDVSGFECLAPGVEVGAEVAAGQIIGWVGDSGNAENTIPHIHFEIRTPDGVPINAYESLKAARTIDFEWLSTDPAAAYSSIVASNYSPSHATAVIVASDEARKLSASENTAATYDSPVLVIDQADPDAAVEQIKQLDVDQLVVISDLDTDWIVELVSPHVDSVEVEAFPLPYTPPVLMLPDVGVVEAEEPNPVDHFATVIAGSLEDLEPEALEALEQFTVEHRSIVLTTESEGATGLSAVPEASPARGVESAASGTRARRASTTEDESGTPLLLWWNTGDEWAWSDDLLDTPERGVVYLTEAQATPWTLTFLSDLAELPQMPLWRG